MDRRRAMKVAAGIFAGGGAGLVTLSSAFKPEKPPVEDSYKLEYDQSETTWKYVPLDPDVTARLAYDYYSEGSCMYATVKSVVAQLAGIIGEPYVSFPYHLFKYGHGGVGGYGSVCGTLNGAAALIGLLIADKSVQDRVITDIFQWYEKAPFPAFHPADPVMDFTPPQSVSNSILCHAANTIWSNESGYAVSSKERKEKCRRLTADVARKVTLALNEIHANIYIANAYDDQNVNSCVSCHGDEGKVKNTSVEMSCNSCHTESLGHRVFADVHYKMMKE